MPGPGNSGAARSAGGLPAARIRVRRPSSGAPFCLSPGGDFVIGRQAGCQLCLDDGSLSRRHARLFTENRAWWIEDLGSANGTCVDGERVTRQRLRGGEILRLGAQVELVFELARPIRAAARGRPQLLTWRLVPREAGPAGRPFLLGRKLAVVGRNPQADLVLPFPQVSDVHARLERRPTGWVVSDLGSVNGTTVNGETVREKAIQPGDEIAFAGLAFRVQRTPLPASSGRWVLGGIATLVALALLLPPMLQKSPHIEKLWTRDMYLEQADRSTRDALQAYDRGSSSRDVARGQFDIAIRAWIAADRLPPEHPSDQELAAVLRKAGEKMSRQLTGRDLFAIYSSLREEAAPEARPAADFSVAGELSRIVAEFGIDTDEQPMPARMVAEVERWVGDWTGPRRSYTERALARAGPQLEMIRRQLHAANLPSVFGYLPFVESAYIQDARSPAGAVGLWQFMAGTGRNYGLHIDGRLDERADPEKSTAAAVRYLQALLNAYGANAFMCAIASYNKGEYGMLTCLKHGADWRSVWKFWDLVERNPDCLPQETIDYVPKFLAAAVVMRRPEQFGLGPSARH
jgi:pSer/pThr/pTyr-binding forkhead associated (FHA) protein